MAYVDFSGDPVLAAHPAVDAPTPATVAPVGLTALEWSVVALAQRDRLGSLRQASRLSVALGKVFGNGGRSPGLADPRLEALRRMAVLSWHRGFAVPVSELAAFFRAGFTADQYEAMLASISTAKSAADVRS